MAGVLGETEQEQPQSWTSAWSAFPSAKKAIDYVGALAVARAMRLPARFDELRKRLRAGLRDTMASQNLPA